MSNSEKKQAAAQDDLKLFLVSHMGPYSCWSLEVGPNAGAAFQGCRKNKRVPETSDSTSCKVEEVKIPGYRIIIVPEEE